MTLPSMRTTRTHVFPARLDSLRDIRASLESFCTDYGLARDACLRTNIVLEELFTNCVRHGHGGDSAEPVWISFECDESGIVLTFEDNARAFNPFRHAAVGLDHTVRMRPVGGLGVLLTTKLVKSRDYAYVFGRNLTRLRLERA